ncbi:PQQ-binding-like beta-propeller repeat protein [Haloarcula litorea]|uniref:outer membrane protein assembly factor BamB family protein n=1 Tax=Haloarcula litorea TaxID=3032579 RepID=UPI0023E7C3AC|nr:PQQ-binding-like beta-propeller repeat protein [Halomicroarcula sp. GDY20]
MPSRRAFLAAAATAAVAGCTESGDGGGGTATPDGATPPTERTDSSTPATDTDTGGRADAEHLAWARSLSGPVTDRPTVADGSVYAGTEAGTLVGVDAATGDRRWQYDTGEAVRGSPTVADGAVVAVAGSQELHASQSVHAVEADSGRRRWRFAPQSWWLDILGVHDGTAYVATTDDHLQASGQTLYAVALADGSTEWSVEIGDNSGGLVTDDRVYVPTHGAVDAVGHDGTRDWRYEVPEYQFRTLSVLGDTVALVSASDPREPVVHGLDRTTGEQRWTFDDWRALTTQAVGDQLLVGGERIASLDPATGEPRWTADVQATLYDAPVADGTLYVGSRTAAAISLSDGGVEWTTPVDAYVARPTGLLDDQVVFRRSESQEDRNRHVLALDAASGERAWSYAGEAELTRFAMGAERVYAGEASTLLSVTP